MAEINYLTQLIDGFLISTWAGIISGVIVYKKMSGGSWFEIVEILSLAFLIFLVLLFVLYRKLLNVYEWLIAFFIFLVLYVIFKLINRRRKYKK